MRRPDVELTDEAATFVERHPDVITRLAGPGSERVVSTALDPADLEVRRTRFRAYIRERRQLAASPEAQAGAEAFLTRYGIAR